MLSHQCEGDQSNCHVLIEFQDGNTYSIHFCNFLNNSNVLQDMKDFTGVTSSRIIPIPRSSGGFPFLQELIENPETSIIKWETVFKILENAMYFNCQKIVQKCISFLNRYFYKNPLFIVYVARFYCDSRLKKLYTSSSWLIRHCHESVFNKFQQEAVELAKEFDEGILNITEEMRDYPFWLTLADQILEDRCLVQIRNCRHNKKFKTKHSLVDVYDNIKGWNLTSFTLNLPQGTIIKLINRNHLLIEDCQTVQVFSLASNRLLTKIERIHNYGFYNSATGESSGCMDDTMIVLVSSNSSICDGVYMYEFHDSEDPKLEIKIVPKKLDHSGHPFSRTLAACAYLPEAIYVCGGVTPDDQICDRVDMFDLDKRCWVEMAPLSKPRKHAQTIIQNHKIYIYGGSCQHFEYYVPEQNTWKVIDKSDFQCDTVSVYPLDDSHIIILGRHYSDIPTLKKTVSFNLYNTSKDCWEVLNGIKNYQAICDHDMIWGLKTNLHYIESNRDNYINYWYIM